MTADPNGPQERGARIVLHIPPRLWYENERGERWIPEPGKSEQMPPPEFQVRYQHGRFPRDVRETILRLNDDGSATEIAAATSSWWPQLVMAMIQTHYTSRFGYRPWDPQIDSRAFDHVLGSPMALEAAISIAAAACERCMNALAYEFGAVDARGERQGYPVSSPQFTESNTRCEFCTNRENLTKIAEATEPGATFFDQTARAAPELFGHSSIAADALCLDSFTITEGTDKGRELGCEKPEGHDYLHMAHLGDGRAVWWQTGDTELRFQPK